MHINVKRISRKILYFAKITYDNSKQLTINKGFGCTEKTQKFCRVYKFPLHIFAISVIIYNDIILKGVI